METPKAEKKLKIAYVSDAIYPYNKGGKEKRLFDISTRLAAKGHDVTIYCMNWWHGKTKEEMVRVENGVKLKAISPYYPLYSGERRSIKEGVMFGLHCFKLIFEDFDVIDVDHMPYFPLFSVRVVCWLKRKKFIGTWNEVWGKDYWIKYLGQLGIVAYVLERLTFLMPDKVISISDHTTNKLKEMGVKKDITTIPLGIDLDYINSIEPSQEKSDVIYVGRLLKHKNVDVLIEAIALVKEQKPDIRCFIIGEGPEREKLNEMVKEKKLEENVKLLGMVAEHSRVYGYMKSSKVFVLPSTREGFGLVVIEANACGLPVITTDHEENAARLLINNDINGMITNLENLKFGIVSTISTNKFYMNDSIVKKQNCNLIMVRLLGMYTL